MTSQDKYRYVDWSSAIQPGMCICLVNGHGNMSKEEWTTEIETELDVATVLSASLGNPGFVHRTALRKMKAVVGENIGTTIGNMANQMITCLKSNLGTITEEHTEQHEFIRSTPVTSNVSNVCRNRSWDFSNALFSSDAFYIYQVMPDGSINDFILDATQLEHTRLGPNKVRVFKKTLFDYIEKKYQTDSASMASGHGPITKFLLVDGACNGVDDDCGMTTTDVREYSNIIHEDTHRFFDMINEVKPDGTRGPVKLGGTKRKRRRKSLKKKFK